jgi:hypothetical protein
MRIVPNHVRMINTIYPYLVLNVYYVAITEDKITMLPTFGNINSWNSLSAFDCIYNTCSVHKNVYLYWKVIYDR